VAECDEPLAPGAIGVVGAGHTDDSAHEGFLAGLQRHAVTGAAVASAGRISALSHETGDDTVEGGAVEELVAGEEYEAVDVLRGEGRQELDGDGSAGGIGVGG